MIHNFFFAEYLQNATTSHYGPVFRTLYQAKESWTRTMYVRKWQDKQKKFVNLAICTGKKFKLLSHLVLGVKFAKFYFMYQPAHLSLLNLEDHALILWGITDMTQTAGATSSIAVFSASSCKVIFL